MIRGEETDGGGGGLVKGKARAKITVDQSQIARRHVLRTILGTKQSPAQVEVTTHAGAGGIPSACTHSQLPEKQK